MLAVSVQRLITHVVVVGRGLGVGELLRGVRLFGGVGAVVA
jgi:hypothetical protein